MKVTVRQKDPLANTPKTVEDTPKHMRNYLLLNSNEEEIERIKMFDCKCNVPRKKTNYRE